MPSTDSFHPDFLGEICRRLPLKSYPHACQFVVQHLFPDTVRLLRTLHPYLSVDTVIGISYSGNPASIDELRSMGIRVVTPDYDELHAVIEKELEDCIARCQQRGLKLVIHEVGGMAIRALHEPHWKGADTVVGALEITKQGVWMAEQLEQLRIPQINVAQTRLKQIEGKQVGEAVVAALDIVLRELGYATVGRDALVCGYGWVGKGVAQSLRRRGLGVSVRDIDIVSVVEAAIDGHTPCRGPTLNRAPAIVVGASGRQSIDAALLAQIPDRCFLVSGSSKDVEIDLNYLKQQTRDTCELHPHVQQCNLHDGRRIFLVNGGYPVNFTGPSVPDEIVEFLFAELIMLVPLLMDRRPPAGIHTLPAEQEALPADIWLELR